MRLLKMESTQDAAAAPNAYVRATETAKYVRSQLPETLQNPKVAIVCGSGLGGLADTIEPEPKVELAYGTIPHFPKSTGMHKARPSNFIMRGADKYIVQGHAGKFVFGHIGPQKTPVALLVGRAQ